MADNVCEQRRPALFLDRDGTIIQDLGDIGEPNQVRFLPGVVQALATLKQHFALFIVTNQSAVSKGRLTLAQVTVVNAHVVDTLAGAGIPIERVFVCPHARTDNCNCIKPNPYFLRVAESEHHIALTRSFTIGDHPHDVEFAHSVGATGIYVLSGHGTRHREMLRSRCVVIESLADAVSVILPDLQSGTNRTSYAFNEQTDEPVPSARR